MKNRWMLTWKEFNKHKMYKRYEYNSILYNTFICSGHIYYCAEAGYVAHLDHQYVLNDHAQCRFLYSMNPEHYYQLPQVVESLCYTWCASEYHTSMPLYEFLYRSLGNPQ